MAPQSENPIMTVYDGSSSSRQAAKIAARLAEILQHTLTVFMVSDSPEKGEQLERDVKNITKDNGMTLRFRRLIIADPRHLAEAVQAEGSGLLVLGAPSQFTEERLICTLLGAIHNSVLLIR
jgi:nucleotide-binding universal stress UspA family protein